MAEKPVMIASARCLFISFLLLPGVLFAQEVVKSVQLDSVMVEAVKGGFKVEDFIELVKNDTSFYKSFRNLHYYPFKFKTSLIVFNRDDNEKATLYREATHHVKEKREWTEITKETTSGNIYKRNGEFRYYTAELLDYTFFPKDTGYASNTIAGDRSRQGGGNKDNYERLKVLIFNPGSEVEGVPLIGKKMAIFDDDVSKYYDYFINADNYQDSIRCYKFICRAKPDAGNNAVIKELVSWFDRRTFNIICRKYSLAYSSIVFDFDVNIEINLVQINGVLVPVLNTYKGSFDVPLRKREIVGFRMEFDDYEIR